MVNSRKHNDMIHITNVNQVVDNDMIKNYSTSNKSKNFYKNDKEAIEVREFENNNPNNEDHIIVDEDENHSIREFENLEDQQQYEQEGEDYPDNDSEPADYHQNDESQENQIYLKNSIADIYKQRQVNPTSEVASNHDEDQVEEEQQSNESNNKDEIIQTLREEINMYKNLICCYELNRQGLLKIVAGLTDNHPNLVNEINPESTENMILLENLIEHYLSIVKFRVTDELEAFDFPDVENLGNNMPRQSLNPESTAGNNKNQTISSKTSKMNTETNENQVYLQHHLLSHMRDFSNTTNVLNQNSFNQSHRNNPISTKSNKQTVNLTPNTRLYSQKNDQENNIEVSHNYSSSMASNKYLNLDIEQLKRDLLKNKSKIQNRIVEIEDQITTNSKTKTSQVSSTPYSQSNYLSFTKQPQGRNIENIKTMPISSKDLMYKERELLRDQEKADLNRDRKFLRD